MSFADFTSINQFLSLLHQYQHFAYLILFFGAFSETFILSSFIIYGEIFFLGGSLLASTGSLEIIPVATVLYAGGILGDNTSYWLGRNFGFRLTDSLTRWPLTRRYVTNHSYNRAVSFFDRKGQAAVFFARLSGPFSWFIPALAGMFKLPYPRFLFFNSLGVIVGISEFLVVGYLFGENIDNILHLLSKFSYLPICIIALGICSWLLHKITRQQIGER